MTLTRALARWFPVPKLLVPNGIGIDVSDSSIKWLSIESTKGGTHVASYGNEHIADGIVQTGAVRDPKALGTALAGLKKHAHISAAHAALPEEGAYVFNMHVPIGSSREQIRVMVEFELENRVPIPPSHAVYDFDTINIRDESGEEIAVTVFPRELADGYVESFARAGIELLSLEIEARSIARSVSSAQDGVTMLVDCGRARTGVAILKHGIPIFTSTVEVGGDHMTKAVMQALSLKSEEEAEKFKNEHGLIVDDPKSAQGQEALEKVASELANEVGKHYRFWDSRREEHAQAESVERVFLIGGSANVHGLPEYIAGKVHVETQRPNVWRNLFSFDDYIPPIEYRASFQYATAIGLALRSK